MLHTFGEQYILNDIDDTALSRNSGKGAIMTIYHGSTVPVEKPQILASNRMLDFGVGFYTTSNLEQAIRWSEIVAAKQETDKCVITEYDFDFNTACNDLVVIKFDKPDKLWLDFVCLNRSGKEYPTHYDIASGPVANDQVFTVVSLYEQGVLSEAAALMEMKVRKLYNQILFHTAKSLNYCNYARHKQIQEYR